MLNEMKVMTREGFDDLVVKGRARRVVKPSILMRAREYAQKIPRNALLPFWILKSIVILVLHFVPIVGPIILVLVAAPKRGRSTHVRYFELKGYSPTEIRHTVDSRRGQYTGFEYSWKLNPNCLLT